MYLSNKCQYALRAVFELAKHHGEKPMPIAKIAEAQAIPPRFLESILAELKRAGYLESRRGVEGGYLLAVSPETLAVGEIIRFIGGPLEPVRCIGDHAGKDCPLLGHCAFMDLWERAKHAVEMVYDKTTFQDLILEEQERLKDPRHASDYCI